MRNNFNKTIVLIFMIFCLALPLHSRFLDVYIAFDGTEDIEGKNIPITYGVALALCQKNNPLIMTSYLFYNILQRQTDKSPLSQVTIDDADWDIYETKQRDYYLFIPKTYKQKISAQYDTPQFRQTVAQLKTPHTANEVLIGFKVDSPQSLTKITMSQFNTEEKINTVKHGEGVIPVILPNSLFDDVFVTGKDDVFGLWNMYLFGHGNYSTGITPNLTMDSVLKKTTSATASIAGLLLPNFRDLLQFFIKKVQMNFLYYMTCYGGDVNMILPYITSLTNARGNIIGGLEKPNFTIAVGALTSEPVTINIQEALESCTAKKTVTPNYARFFELLKKYGKREGTRPTLYKDAELKEILGTITTRANFAVDDPHGISALPSVMFPGTDTFRAIPLDDTIFVVSNVLTKKHILEKQPIVANNKDVILVYPADIPVPLQLNSSKRTAWALVSMVPGLSLNQFESLETNISFADFARISLGSTKPVFNKYFYIKKLKIKNADSLKGYSDGTLELRDVFISLIAEKSAAEKPLAKVDILFTGPDQVIHAYSDSGFGSDARQEKFGEQIQSIPDNSFLNALHNYFYALDEKNQVRRNFDFESLKKILSAEDIKVLESAKVIKITKKIDVKELNEKLFEAVENKSLSKIKELLKQGASANAVDEDDKPVLLEAIGKKSINKDMVQVLLEQGADVNSKDDQEVTALMSATAVGNKEIVQLLLKNKADVNRLAQGNLTALIFAAVSNSKDIVQLLLQHGADRTIKDAEGKTAYDYAAEEGHSDLAALLKNK